MSDDNPLCPLCRHPLSAHETLDHDTPHGPRPAVRLPDGRFVQVRRRVTLCTQGRLAPVDASPWDHVCGCIWTHDAEDWRPWEGQPDPPEPYPGTPIAWTDA